MKEIVIENDNISGGGVEKILWYLTNYLENKKYHITIVTENGSREEFYKYYSNKIRFIRRIPIVECRRFSRKWFCNRFQYIVCAFIVYCFFRVKCFDIAIAMKEGPCLSHITKIRALKKFAWIHVDYRYMHWTKALYQDNLEERKQMQQYDRVICVSNATKQSVIDTIGDPGNLCVCYNPINDRLIRKRSMESNGIMEREKDPLLFVSVGRLVRQKNYLLLLEVCAKLEKKYDFKVWIIGDGVEKKVLEQKISELEIKSVELLGEKENPYPYIKKADCFVSSALWESYGLAIQESLVLGVPVVATSCPAIKETLDEKYGMIVENTLEALKDALEKIMCDPEVLKQYRKNIKLKYNTAELYEERLEKICRLWEQ